MVKMTKGADIAWATGPKKRMKKFAHPVGGSYNIGAQQPQRWNSGPFEWGGVARCGLSTEPIRSPDGTMIMKYPGQRRGRPLEIEFTVEDGTLSKQKDKQRVASTTTTKQETATSEDSLEALTPLEEKVIRMSRGLSEEDAQPLQFGLGADRETMAKLALIEKQMVDAVAQAEVVSPAEEGRQTPAELLSSWLDGDQG